MKLNNKGMTLIELLMSIGLIGIVVVFLFQLLVDIKSETNNNSFAYNNQINKLEVIYQIEQDLNNNLFVGLEDKTIGDVFIINFHFKKSQEIISTELRIDTEKEINKLNEEETVYYIKYTNYENKVTRWKVKDAVIDTCGLYTFYIDTDTSNYYFKLNLFVYNYPNHDLNNKENNNAVDDIEISYMGNKNDLIKNSNYLTYEAISNKKIGTCTN